MSEKASRIAPRPGFKSAHTHSASNSSSAESGTVRPKVERDVVQLGANAQAKRPEIIPGSAMRPVMERTVRPPVQKSRAPGGWPDPAQYRKALQEAQQQQRKSTKPIEQGDLRDEIHSENVKKLQEMSPEEIANAQEELRRLLGDNLVQS